MPFGFPQCVFAGEAFASQHDAKVSLFRFCIGVFKENTDTQVSRKQPLQNFCFHFAAPFFSKTFCFFRLPLVVAMRRELQKKRRCFSPHPSLQSGNAREVSEGTSEFTFLVTSLLNDKEVTQKRYSERARSAV